MAQEGNHAGAWNSNIWLPDDCEFPMQDDVVRRMLRNLEFLVFGDSISQAFAHGLQDYATTRFIKVNGDDNEFNGLGMSYLFEPNGLFVGERPTYFDPGADLQLHPQRWPKLRDAINASDVAILNSGLHDMAQYNIQGIGWYGEKGYMGLGYLAYVEALFARLRADGLHDRVIWRMTTYPALLHAQSFVDKDSNPASKWYYRCDTQHVRPDSVARLNDEVRLLGSKYGIAMVDFSGLFLSAHKDQFQDIVHPNSLLVKEMVRVLAHHRVLAHGKRNAAETLPLDPERIDLPTDVDLRSFWEGSQPSGYRA
jgi:hypothetical protein